MSKKIKNYALTWTLDKVEIFDKETIDLSYNNYLKIIIVDEFTLCKSFDASNSYLTEVDLNLPNCEEVYLNWNQIQTIKLNIPNCTILHLDYNFLCEVNVNIPNCKELQSDPQTVFIQDNGEKIKSIDCLPIKLN